MLTEGVFKAYMDDAMASMREDVRNLHIEMLKQFHVQQVRIEVRGIVCDALTVHFVCACG
jgi:hypothetical protein